MKALFIFMEARMAEMFFTHPQFKDIFIELLAVQYRDDDRIKIKVRYWNKSQTGNPFCLHLTNKLTLTPQKWREFVRTNPS